MNITILGSGNVATYFGLALYNAGWHIRQVFSPRNAAELAAKLGTIPVDDPELLEDADIFIIAVKDDAFKVFSNIAALKDKIVIHCSGSNSLGMFAGLSTQLGVIWPLYSVNKHNLPVTRDIPLVVDASTTELLAVVRKIAAAISDNIHHLDDASRNYLHLSAVLVNNFTNHLYAMAEQICLKQQIDFQILQPIISQGIDNVKQGHLVSRQTGPAIRNDFNTISRHMDMLQHMGLARDVYQSLTQSIIQFRNIRRD